MTEYKSPVGRCPDCGKQSFITRKAARAVLRAKFKHESMTIYRCGDYFHFGHTPGPIKRGNVDRRYWVEERQR